jgi:hypothetical protein
MNRTGWIATMLAATLCVLFSVPAGAQEFRAKISGFQEVGGLGAAETGAILSSGEGTLKLTLDKDAKLLNYELTYSGLTSVLQSHIHFGKNHVAGGIMVFFCTNLGIGPAGTPVCPAAGGTVTGQISASGVVGPAGQNVTAGNFDAVIAALTSNTAYVNIHTTKFPMGEIRGQIIRGSIGKGNDHDHDKDDNHH